MFLLCFAAGKEEGRDRKGYGKREKREKREKRKAESGGRRSWRRAKTLAGNDAAAVAGSRLSYSVFTLCVCVCFATVISIKCNHALLVCVCVCNCLDNCQIIEAAMSRAHDTGQQTD